MTDSYLCDMTDSYLCDMTDSYLCDMTDSYLCDMTHSHVWHGWFTWNMTHGYEVRLNHTWHDSSICVTWLIYLRDMTRLFAWHDSSICLRTARPLHKVHPQMSCWCTMSQQVHTNSLYTIFMCTWDRLLLTEIHKFSEQWIPVNTPQHTATHRNKCTRIHCTLYSCVHETDCC